MSAASLCLGERVHALDPERAMSQYLHQQWESADGFPGGPVHSLAQGPDGYLWIGAEKGLVRFDGLRFRLFDPAGVTLGLGRSVLGVAPGPDGTLWARLRGPSLVRFRNGAFENILPSREVPQAVVSAMAVGRTGSILLAILGQGALSYHGGKFTTITPASSIPTTAVILSIVQSADGEVWLGTRGGGLLRVQPRGITRILDSLPDLKINALLPGANGELWIGTDKGLARWTGHEVTTRGIPESLKNVPVLAMVRDRESNIWIAAGALGLVRFNSTGVTTYREDSARASRAVTTLLEDRDGNLWVGTTRGVERLRDGVFTTYSTAQGLPSDSVGPVHVDASGRTWFGPPQGGLFWLHGEKVGRIDQAGLKNDVIYSIAGGGEEVWIGRQKGGLTRLTAPADGSFVTREFTHADGLAQNSVYAVHRSRDGAIWAGTLSGGVTRLKHGVFTTYSTREGLASNTVASIADTADGTMWFATPGGVSTLSREGWRRHTTRDGLPSNDVNVLLEDSGDIWAGTAGGLARFRKGHLEPPLNFPAVLRTSILGLAADGAGSLWIATAEGVFRVHRDALGNRPGADGSLRAYGIPDGLMALEGVKRHRTVLTDPQGRVWFAMARGLSVVDPRRVQGPGPSASVQIEGVSADGVSLDHHRAVEIPSGRQRVTLTYAGLSLSVPERVRFKYRLDDFDHDWSEPVAERQAVYTNLNPGAYVFRVVASNAHGVWNGREEVLRFSVMPQVWQKTWFRMCGLLLCAVAGWAAYRLRVRQVAGRLNKRFEERLAERTRIAQELHDTLLQGFVSASMHLHVAADRLPPDSPARPSLNRVLELMERVVEEGRKAVQGLRSFESQPEDLEQAFSGVHLEFAGAQHTEYRVITEGQPQRLKLQVRDEVYRIGREALVNAFRHSGASLIEIELAYSPAELRMLVRDNGCGIDPRVVNKGTDGHWGLIGMRERAAAIGGILKVRSRDAAGTEVELSIPAAVAYRGAGRASLGRAIVNRISHLSKRQTYRAPGD